MQVIQWVRPWARRVWLGVGGLIGVLAVLLAISLVGAALTRGNESLSAKWADWLRSHHAGLLADRIEHVYYTHRQPPKGGHLLTLNPLPIPGPPPTTAVAPLVPDPATTSTTVPPPAYSPQAPGPYITAYRDGAVAHLQPPPPVPLVVSPAVPGEGQWRPVGATINGWPVLYEAQFRADAVYTSQITTAVWIDTSLLRLGVIPGLKEPGGTWPHPPYLQLSELPAALAAFNGGFRMQDARGGFWLAGRTAHPLVAGAASIVLRAGGQVDIGSWGSEVGMAPDVTAVVQNLVLLVDHGQAAPAATYDDTKLWGYTLGSKTVVARSGIGITADGGLIYVAGPALTARSLAESLQRAGAVRAMSLDINPEWVTWNFYEHQVGRPGDVAGVKLYPQMQRPASRYLPPTAESRYFFTVSLPPDAVSSQ